MYSDAIRFRHENPPLIFIRQDICFELVTKLLANADVLSIEGILFWDVLAIFVVRVVWLSQLSVFVPFRICGVMRHKSKIKFLVSHVLRFFFDDEQRSKERSGDKEERKRKRRREKANKKLKGKQEKEAIFSIFRVFEKKDDRVKYFFCVVGFCGFFLEMTWIFSFSFLWPFFVSFFFGSLGSCLSLMSRSMTQRRKTKNQRGNLRFFYSILPKKKKAFQV